MPIDPSQTILVAGDGADNIGKQAGGWTLSWQGTGNSNDDFPNGQSVFDGIAEAVASAGGSAILSEDGSFGERPDVAIVVFGEDPYAEFQGDMTNVDYPKNDGLSLLTKFRSANIPTIAVFLSGRPMWVNPELNQSDAFVAAWLPGGQGGGIADVLIADETGAPRFDFRGKLSYTWPQLATQTDINVGDATYEPLFAYGYGLTYASNITMGPVGEKSGLDGDDQSALERIIVGGDAAGPWRMVVRDAGGTTQITDAVAVSTTEAFRTRVADFEAQEDTRILDWSGRAVLTLEGNPADLSRQSNGDMAIAITFRVDGEAVGPTRWGMACEGTGCGGQS